MPTFASRSRDASGSLIEKTVEAETRREALRILEASGLSPVEINEVMGEQGSNSDRGLGLPLPTSPRQTETRTERTRNHDQATDERARPSDSLPAAHVRETERAKRFANSRLSRKSLRRFTVQLGSSLKAGVPIHTALRAMASQSEDPRYAATVEHLTTDLEGGLPLSEAMRNLPRAFPSLYVGTIEAGELSGTLEEMLDDLAEYVEAEMEIRADVRSAVLYPAMVMGALLCAMAVMVFFVVPRFAVFYAGFDADLPLPTRILISSSDLMQSYGLWITGGLIALALAAVRVQRIPRVNKWRDRVLLRIPFVGRLIETAATLQIARMLQLVTSAGLPLLEGLETIASAARSTKSKEDLRSVASGIESGGTLSEGLEAARCLPADARQMIATGEQTGSLNQACAVVSEQYKKELRYLTKNTATFIEPVLTLFLAGVVLFVALAAFLPMWDLVRVVRK